MLHKETAISQKAPGPLLFLLFNLPAKQSSDRAVLSIAELIHDTDLEDDKFHRVEGFGVEQIFKGWAKQGLADQEILSKGFECFDGLYAQFKRS